VSPCFRILLCSQRRNRIKRKKEFQ
jgi:hypothetical protein